MNSNHKLGEIELRGSRLYLIKQMNGMKVDVDVTPLWHFFKEVDDFTKNPKPIDEFKSI